MRIGVLVFFLPCNLKVHSLVFAFGSYGIESLFRNPPFYICSILPKFKHHALAPGSGTVWTCRLHLRGQRGMSVHNKAPNLIRIEKLRICHAGVAVLPPVHVAVENGQLVEIAVFEQCPEITSEQSISFPFQNT